MSIGIFIQALLILVIPAYLLVMFVLYKKQQKLENQIESMDSRIRLILASDIRKMIGKDPINREAKILINLARFLEKTAGRGQIVAQTDQPIQLVKQYPKIVNKHSSLSLQKKSSDDTKDNRLLKSSQESESKAIADISLGQLILDGFEYLAGVILLFLPLMWWKTQVGHGNYSAQLIFLGIMLVLTILIAVWRGHGFYNFVAYILLFLILISWFAINSVSIWWIFLVIAVFIILGRTLPKSYQPEYYLLAVFGLLSLAAFSLLLPETITKIRESLSSLSLDKISIFGPRQFLAWGLLATGYISTYLRSRDPAKFDLKQRLITALYSISYIGALIIGFYSQTSSWILILLIIATILGLVWVIKIESLSEMVVIVLLLSYIVGLQFFDLLNISNAYIGYSILFVSLVGYSLSYLLTKQIGNYLRNFSIVGILLALFTQLLTDITATTLVNIATSGVILVIFDQIIRVYQKRHALEEVTSYLDNNQLEQEFSLPVSSVKVQPRPRRQNTADIRFVGH
ncbi:hypothetical protein KA531_03420 [Candidatus Saccharibacteria bacterium]|nr:hypothetical protein [Candidatus Saccharibacteria bacterium]